jgi:hypothetical protein
MDLIFYMFYNLLYNMQSNWFARIVSRVFVAFNFA